MWLEWDKSSQVLNVFIPPTEASYSHPRSWDYKCVIRTKKKKVWEVGKFCWYLVPHKLMTWITLYSLYITFCDHGWKNWIPSPPFGLVQLIYSICIWFWFYFTLNRVQTPDLLFYLFITVYGAMLKLMTRDGKSSVDSKFWFKLLLTGLKYRIQRTKPPQISAGSTSH